MWAGNTWSTGVVINGKRYQGGVTPLDECRFWPYDEDLYGDLS